MTVAELGRRMDIVEFRHWLALDTISPIGSRRLDLLFAQLGWIVATMLSSSNQPLDVRAFDLFSPERDHNSADSPKRSLALRKLDAIKLTKALGGKVIKHGHDRQTQSASERPNRGLSSRNEKSSNPNPGPRHGGKSGGRPPSPS